MELTLDCHIRNLSHRQCRCTHIPYLGCWLKLIQESFAPVQPCRWITFYLKGPVQLFQNTESWLIHCGQIQLAWMPQISWVVWQCGSLGFWFKANKELEPLSYCDILQQVLTVINFNSEIQEVRFPCWTYMYYMVTCSVLKRFPYTTQPILLTIWLLMHS